MKVLSNFRETGGPNRTTAFTIVEVLATVSILAILALIAVTMIGGLHQKARDQKLQSDVDLLNRAVVAYLHSNGELDGSLSVDQVLSRLKSAATAESGDRILGIRGSFIDPSLTYSPQSATDASAGKARAIWDPTRFRFVVQHDGPPGIASFSIDPDGSGVPAKTDNRSALLDLAVQDPWIWDYNDATPPPPSGPAPEVVVSRVPTGPLPTASTPPVAKTRLVAPAYSIPSSSRPVTDFDLAILLTNPNADGTSTISYSIDYGEWTPFTGAPVMVPPGGVVKAQAIPIDTDAHYSSTVIENTYVATEVPLETPTISGSVSAFGPGADASELTITNPNPDGISKLVYQIDGGGWNDYAGPFTLSAADYPAGATITTKAAPILDYYLESGTAAFDLIGSPVKLDPPQIVFSATAFSNDKNNPVDEISVQLNNVNPLGSSIVSYRIVPVPGGVGATTGYMDYTGPFSIRQAFYPSGFGIQTYTKPLKSGYEDSDEVTRYASTVEGTFGGHLDLDTAVSLSAKKYNVDVLHTHDYTGKFGLTSVDFFALLGDKHHDLDDSLPSASQKFKILLINGNLSPGMRVVLHEEREGKTLTRSLPVTEYDDIPVHELPVYSLDGSGESIRLAGIEATFGQDVILNAGALPTEPKEVISNKPGKNNEWRNGALTFQAVAVNGDGSDAFGTTAGLSNGGVHGVATTGLLWEGMLYWHWDGKSYDDKNNLYRPGDPTSVEGFTTERPEGKEK